MQLVKLNAVTAVTEIGKGKMSESSSANTIARERVDNIASRNSEPTWLKELRLGAWESYLQTPMPSARDEDWRKVEIESLNLSSLKTIDLPAAVDTEALKDLPEYFQTALKAFSANTVGVVAETGEAGWRRPISAELEKKGVVFCSLKTAIEKHHALVKPYLEKSFVSDGKFGLMNKALFNSGAFLYVPANVEVPGLLLALVHLQQKQISQGIAVFPRTIIVLGANSKANVFCSASTAESNKDDRAGSSLSNASVEVYVGNGAKLTYLETHKFGASTFVVSRNNYEIGRDAFLYSMTVGLGGGQIKSDLATQLTAPGANVDVEGVVIGDRNEHFSFSTIVDHIAPDCKSNINFRVALKDRASSSYIGAVKVAKEAQKTDSYQSNKNLLLGAESKADSIPKLEILADDVKCSHGATVGPVDQEQIFFLMSRGLKRADAEQFIVEGFFRTILDTCTIEGATDYITEQLAEKIHAQKQ